MSKIQTEFLSISEKVTTLMLFFVEKIRRKQKLDNSPSSGENDPKAFKKCKSL